MAKRCGRWSSDAFVETLEAEADPEWDVRTVEFLGMIPNYYLQYFYYTDKKVAVTEEMAAIARRRK